MFGGALLFDFSLDLRVSAFNYARDDGMSLACSLEVSYHFAYCSACIEFTKPCRNVSIWIIWISTKKYSIIKYF